MNHLALFAGCLPARGTAGQQKIRKFVTRSLPVCGGNQTQSTGRVSAALLGRLNQTAQKKTAATIAWDAGTRWSSACKLNWRADAMATPDIEALPPIERAIFKHSLIWSLELLIWEVRNGLREWPTPAAAFLTTIPAISASPAFDWNAGAAIIESALPSTE